MLKEMKNIALIIGIIFLGCFSGFSQSIVNKGSNIYVSNATTLTFVSDYENLDDGDIRNEGQLHLKKDWINNGLYGGILSGTSGSTFFNGDSAQQIKGTTASEFNNLNIHSEVEMYSDVSVWNELNLSGGRINLLDNNLSYQGWSGISYTSDFYCITEGAGKLNLFVDMMIPTTFPVGTAMSYAPLTLSTNSASDIFSVNLITNVLSNGNSGSPIPEIDDCVKLTWNVDAGYSTWVDYNLEVQWNAIDEGINFNRGQSAIGIYHTSIWNGNNASAASGANPYTQSIQNVTSTGSFAVGDLESPMTITLDLIVDITAFLEGPFDGSEMLTLLNDDGYLPLSQPYHASYWNYYGNESVASIPNANVVDWVLVELRDAVDAPSATAATMIERQAAFVLVDGTIVGMDGLSDIQFTTLPSQNLFVVVYHRNHLSVMSANPLTESGGIYSYNFSTGANQAYSDVQAGQKEIATGVWGMFGGDGANGGHITEFDKNIIWQPESGTKGYSQADYNLDGQVENKDKNEVWVDNYMRSSQVPE
jgi:hypothetical protein